MSGSASESSLLPEGKLPPDLLAELLGRLPTQDAGVVLGPGVGEDAALLSYPPASGHLLAAKSDPITFATDEIGFYAVNVCANDLAVSGARPRYYLVTALFPAGQTTADTVREVFDQLARACADHGIVVVGGHSEVTSAVAQPVVAGTMLGHVDRGRYVTSHGCRPGDVLLLAGVVPVEGTSIIAREKREELLARGWSPAELDQAAAFLYEPGISVVEPALAVAEAGLVTAMHDPTEGGVATGLWELAAAAQVGLDVDLDAIPVPPISARLCGAFGLDPLGTIASGALLATCPPEHVEPVLAAWRSVGREGRVIGQVLPPEAGVRARRGGTVGPLPRFSADEITRLWG